MGRINERVQRARDTRKPVGVYTVDLIDSRSGRVVERQQKENYVTELWEKQHIAHQYGNLYYSYGIASASTVWETDELFNTAGAPFANRVYNPGAGVNLPFDSVVCTDWTSPEDTGVHWGRGQVVAWGTRWKATVSASGLRGQINEAECLFSNDGLTHKTVWDWTTSQGNGTFQSLMLAGVKQYGNPANQALFCGVGPHTIAYGLHASSYVSVQSNIWIEGSTAYFIASTSNSLTANLNVYSMAVSDIFAATPRANEPWVYNGAGSTVTSVCSTGLALGNATTTSTTNSSPYQRCTLGLVKLGAGDFCITWIGTNGTAATSANGRRLWFRRIQTDGTQVVANTQFGDTASVNMYWSGSAGASTSYPACTVSATYDGTYLYAMAGCGESFGTGVKGKIYRVNVADGTLSTTINFPSGYTSCTDGGMAIHNGDLLVSTLQGIIRIDTGGTLVHPYNYGSVAMGHYGESQTAGSTYSPLETAESPFVTTAGFFIGSRGQGTIMESRTDTFGRRPAGGISMGADPTFVFGNDNTQNTIQARFSLGNMVVYDDELWFPLFGDPTLTTQALQKTDIWTSGTYPAFLLKANGANMFSRVLLDNPATKTSSQTMKISYEITFPDPYDVNRIPGPNDLTEATEGASS